MSDTIKLRPFEEETTWAGQPCRTRICVAKDRIAALKHMSPEDLRAVMSDPDVQLTVRLAAERLLRKSYLQRKGV